MGGFEIGEQVPPSEIARAHELAEDLLIARPECAQAGFEKPACAVVCIVG
jgi:hypothetical protein